MAALETNDTHPQPSRECVADMVKQVTGLVLGKSSFDGKTVIKNDGSVVTEIDHTIQSHLQEKLAQRWPQYGFIGEEMPYDDQVKVSNANATGYWVLDPLDGTTNFANGFLFYGVSLALVVGGEPVVSVVYDPVRDECFSATKGLGAYLNNSRLRCPAVSSLAYCVANVDYKRLTADLSTQLVRCPPYRSQRNLGASVLEWCWLAAGRIQLYLHGGQKLWDFAAGYLILLEAGGAATSLSGQPLDCNKLRKRAVVAAVSSDLLVQWENWIHSNCEISQFKVHRADL